MRENWTSWLVTSTVQLVLPVWLLSKDLWGLMLAAAVVGVVAVGLLAKLALERLSKGRR
ncbi:hypothetical protein QOL99_00720 [Deinococcus sp. MIMF12]|uniref:Uncharacterized protein n=1 Tax=Deinococcus rhizophilus TaxID=3049544 RepID=A0ABT7JCA9_9DEIO|nr:hypothetical protein [Deinococcus rhizophilus]MDL2342666.1 hypothetical protein [Deinococcus rhizophilus]